MSAALPVIAIAYACGIVVGAVYRTWALGLWITAAATAALLIAACFSTRRFLLIAAVAAVTMGMVSTASMLDRDLPGCFVGRYHGRNRVRLMLAVSSSVVNAANVQRQRARALWIDRGDGDRVSLCGDVELVRPAADSIVEPGQRIIVYAQLKGISGGANSASSLQTMHYGGRPIGGAVFAPEASLVRVGRAPADWLSRTRERLRRALTGAIDDAGGRSILSAIVLGQRDALGFARRQHFARAGLSHLLAVSGLHLSLVAVGVLVAIRSLLRRWTFWSSRFDVGRCAALGASAIAVLYTLITGASPATVRACVMACSCFAGLVFGRVADLARPLSLAALLILGADPMALGLAGFQLSFAAVVGIGLIMSHPRARRICRHERRPVRVLGTLVLASLGATLLTSPLVAHHFRMVSVVGLATNIVAVPWTSLVLLPSSLIGAVLALAYPVGGGIVLRVAAWSAARLDDFARIVGTLSWAAIDVSTGWMMSLGLTCVGIAVLATGRLRRAVASVALLLIAASALPPKGRPDARIEATFIDVGQGDSIFVRLPDHATLLVDAGGSSHGDYDPGERRVVPFLRAAGVRRLDYLVVSHPDADHAGGVEAVLEAVAVGEIWSCRYGADNAWQRRLLRWAARHGVSVGAPRPVYRGNSVIRPIWPRTRAGTCGDPQLSTNNNSIVLRIDFGQGSLLLAGDIEGEVERRLLSTESAELRATVLKVAHHGSSTSSGRDWLQAVNPSLAVVSCGIDNRFGFPRPQVLARYEALAIPVARTDERGSIVTRIFGDGTVSWQASQLSFP